MRSWTRTLLGMAIGWGLAAPTDLAISSEVAAQSRPPACELDVELVALVYAPEDPAQSMALVGAKRGRLVRIGSWVGDRQVIAMAPRSVVLGPVEDPCLMRLTDRSPSKPPPRSKRRRRRPRRR
jgi:hypothetical protein